MKLRQCSGVMGFGLIFLGKLTTVPLHPDLFLIMSLNTNLTLPCCAATVLGLGGWRTPVLPLKAAQTTPQPLLATPGSYSLVPVVVIVVALVSHTRTCGIKKCCPCFHPPSRSGYAALTNSSFPSGNSKRHALLKIHFVDVLSLSLVLVKLGCCLLCVVNVSPYCG